MFYRMENNKYDRYIEWHPTEQTKREVIIITAGTNIKDEVKLLMEAY